MLPTGMFISMACREEGEEHLVAPAEVGRDDVRAAFDVMQDRAVMLPHAPRSAAGAARIDDAGELLPGHPFHPLPNRGYVRGAPGQLGPVMHVDPVWNLARANVLDADDM